MTAFQILAENNYEITLIEAFSCNTKDELNARERYFIETILCVNKQHPGRHHKEYVKENTETFKSYLCQYREANKEKLDTFHKEYYQKNKDKMSKKCEICKSELVFGNLIRHNKTKKHMDAMNAL